MKAPLHSRIALFLLSTCLFAAGASADGSSDLYVSGRMGVAFGSGDSGGSIDLGPSGMFPNSGSDSDMSPVYALAFGYEVPLADMFPLPWDVKAPGFALRFEIEASGDRDHELVTSGADPFFTQLSTWTILSNLWVDMPVHDAFSRWTGRVPLLEPLSFELGGGFGLGFTSIETSNNVAFGDTDDTDIVWQAGAGFGYALTDRVTLALAYRYVGLGTHSFPLVDSVSNTIGSFSLDMGSHEGGLAVRVRFYSLPAPNTWGGRRIR